MAGALPLEEYRAKLEYAGFSQVNITITKMHNLNIEIVKNAVGELTLEELDAIDGISASALITAIK